DNAKIAVDAGIHDSLSALAMGWLEEDTQLNRTMPRSFAQRVPTGTSVRQSGCAAAPSATESYTNLPSLCYRTHLKPSHRKPTADAIRVQSPIRMPAH